MGGHSNQGHHTQAACVVRLHSNKYCTDRTQLTEDANQPDYILPLISTRLMAHNSGTS